MPDSVPPLTTWSPSRRNLLKASGLVLGAGFASPLLASCGSSGSSSSSAPSSLGTRPAKLSILYAGDQAAGAGVEALLPAVKDKLGITVTLENLPYDQLQTKTFSELATSNPQHDIYIIDTPWTPTLTKVLEPLDSYLTSKSLNKKTAVDVEDFIARGFYDTSVYNIDSASKTFTADATSSVDLGKIKSAGFAVLGLPIQSNALTMAYRKDLFDDPAEQAAFQSKYGRPLAVPVTWDDFVDVATHFTKPDGSLYGTTLMAGVGDWAVDDFKTLVGSFGGDGHLISGDMKIQITTAEAKSALQLYVDLINKHKVVPPGTTGASWDNATSSFGSGQTAMTMNYGPQALNDNVKGQISYALVPKKTQNSPHEGTWQLSIPTKKPDNTKAWAYQVIAYLTSTEAQKQMLTSQLHPTRTSVYAAAASDASLTSTYANFYDILGKSLAAGTGRARVKNYSSVVQPIAVGVNDAARQAAPVDEAMDSAAKNVQRVLKGLGITSTIAS